MRTFPILISTLALTAIASAQDLRRGLLQADAVLVGRQVGKRPHGDVALHRVQVIAHVRGATQARAVTVIDWPQLSLHIRPTPRQSRLFCLQDASAVAERLGLPTDGGPYYKLVGWAGSHPLVGKDVDQDPVVRFARVLADADRGTSPEITAAALAHMAITAPAPVRTEVARLLTERGDLRSKLSGVHWTQLVARASGEVDDIDYKIALAELCCEQRIDGLLDALAVSLGPVTDLRYARCVGRIGNVLHGEGAADKLLARLRFVAKDADRRMLLLAIGATNTRSAADALLRMDRADAAVQAALREHRSKRARAAVSKKSARSRR
ncbi:MAG TPA: hypothetical protein ENI87_09970 [bacterium]|nr:hypothetical protein [bacterium]